jgi:3-hydroxyisobutyrate dehydrogenase
LSKKVGFIGLGEMGMAMAENLQEDDFEVLAYDVDDEILEEAEKKGITAVKTAKEVAENTDDTILLVVKTAEQVEEVLFGETGVTEADKEALNIVIISTLKPSVMKELQGKIENEGHQLIEAPVSGAESGAKEGSLTIMTAGLEEAVDSVEEYFEVLGEDVFYFGEEYGSAQQAKLINNLVLGINIVALAEGMKTAEVHETPKEELLKLINKSTGGSWVSENWEAVSEWTSDDTLGVLHDDLLAIMEENNEIENPMPFTAMTAQMVFDSLDTE